MRRELTSKLGTVSLAALLLAVPQLAAAQEADLTPLNADIGFIFTTFMFLVSGFLVFFMAAGFAMFLVSCIATFLPRTKPASNMAKPAAIKNTRKPATRNSRVVRI